MIKKGKISKTPKRLIKYFNDNPSHLPSFKKEEATTLFEDAKNEFFNFNESKWHVKPCLEFINLHQLEPLAFIGFLEYLFSNYFEEIGKRTGQKIAYDLIVTLKSSKKFNSSGSSNKGFQLKKKTSPLEVIADSKVLMSNIVLSHEEKLEVIAESKIFMSNFIMSQEEKVEFLFKHFNFGYTYSTLRRYFMDNKK